MSLSNINRFAANKVVRRAHSTHSKVVARINGVPYTMQQLNEKCNRLTAGTQAVVGLARKRDDTYRQMAGTTHYICPKCGGEMHVVHNAYICTCCGHSPDDDINEVLREEGREF